MFLRVFEISKCAFIITEVNVIEINEKSIFLILK